MTDREFPICPSRYGSKHVPPRGDAPSGRSRLLRWLQDHRSFPLVWIDGPPGSGKTYLAAADYGSMAHRGAWYRLTPEDADPHCLQEGLAAAMGADSSDLRDALATLAGPWTLTLDDGHEIDTAAPVHHWLSELAQWLPPGVQVRWLDRRPPPAVYSRLEVSHQLVRLNADALAFTASEVDDLGATDPDLHRRTEGWALGVSLLHPACSEHADDRRRRLPADYFESQVLGDRPREERRLLVAFASLGHFDSRLTADGGVEKDARLLRTLAAKGLFVVPHGPGFRLQPLFRQYLLDHGAALVGAQVFTDLQRRAAPLLESDEQAWDALQAWTRAGDWAEATRVLLANAPAWLAAGRQRPLLRWLDAVPGACVAENTWLEYWRGECLLVEHAADGRDVLVGAYRRFLAQDDVAGCYAAWSAAAMSYYLERNSHNPVGAWLDELRRLRQRHSVPPDPISAVRVAMGAYAMMITGWPGHTEMDAYESELLRAMDQPLPPTLQQQLGNLLLHRNVWATGRRERALMVLERMRPYLDADAATGPLQRCIGHTFECGFAWWFEVDVEQAQTHLQSIRALVEDHRLAVWRYPMQLMDSYIAVSTGRNQAAARVLADMIDGLDPLRYAESAHFHALSAWLNLSLGHAEKAADHLALAGALREQAASPVNEGWVLLLKALLSRRHRDYRAALAGLATARRFFDALNSENFLTIRRLLVALIALDQGPMRRAHRALRAALAGCRRRGYVRLPCLTPDVVRDLCTAALQANFEVKQAADMILAYGLRSDPKRRLDNWPWLVRVRALGGFRVECNGRILRSGTKERQQPMALLRLLVALGDGGHAPEAIADLLWPDADGDKARTNLNTTVHRLRGLLGDKRAVLNRDGRMRLNPRHCWVDAWALLGTRADAPAEWIRSRLHLFRGPFLPGYGEHWVVRTRSEVAAKTHALEVRLESVRSGDG